MALSTSKLTQITITPHYCLTEKATPSRVICLSLNSPTLEPVLLKLVAKSKALQ
jgi:hypothetical protein